MDVTEKFLNDIGGWQAMKTAREYVRLGSVAETSLEGNTYRGLVGEGKRKFRATLIVKDARQVDGKCSCPDAQRGLICAHVLAAALAIISMPSLKPISQPAVFSQKVVPKEAPKVILTPELAEEKIPNGLFTIYLSTEQWRRLPQGTVPIFLKFDRASDDKELAVGRWLHRQGMPVHTGAFRLGSRDLSDLLQTLIGHPRTKSGNPNDKSASNLLIDSSLKLKSHIKRDLKLRSAYFQVDATKLLPFQGGESVWVLNEKALHVSRLSEEISTSARDFFLEVMQKGNATKPLAWVVEHLNELREVLIEGEGAESLFQIRVLPLEPSFVLQLDGNLRGLRAQGWVKVGDKRHPLAAPDEGLTDVYPIEDSEDKLLYYGRNILKETSAIERLKSCGFTFNPQGFWEIKNEDAILKFHSSELRRARAIFEIEEGDQWQIVSRGLVAVRPQVHSAKGQEAASSGMDWLSLEVSYEAADGFRIPRNEVLRLIRSGKRDVKGKDGKRYILDVEGCEELEDTLQDSESRFEQGGQRIAMRSRQMGVLENFVSDRAMLSPLDCAPMDEAELKKVLGKLGEMLRPYQLEGVQWMEKLSRMAGGALLADEMGLGKTVQTLALLRILLARRGSDSTAPVVVVCPTSLLSNWADEAQRFVPDLKTHISHETERMKHLTSLSKFDVIFTSYALIVRDLEYYRKIDLTAVILDEASYIRNPDTETAKAVRQLRAQARFALTGTPVENGVKDLWSVFQFIMPGYLPQRDAFHERFVKPMGQADAAQSRVVMERLRRLIRPYMLRRTKRDVVKELPDKIEKVIWCDMTAPQREIYQRVLDEGREEIRQARRKSGQGSARMTMFTVLLRLRQICNDLRLLKMENTPEASGGKWPMLEETFQEIVEGGHKALIFSQFVGMLKLIREKIEALGIPYSYLDGSSTDRPEQVAAFQKEGKKTFFLISLKAGGYGLNLTAADHVMLIDPWWNPAVEAQAIDRAHRIGQGKTVTAYRMITRGTVEEKILRLQAQKRAVMDMTFDDDQAIMGGVSDDELEAMLN